jgi:hypothetical protein
MVQDVQGASTVWNGIFVSVSSYNTGKGERRVLLCPSCGRRKTMLLLSGRKVLCKSCDTSDHYHERNTINYSDPEGLISYHIAKHLDLMSKNDIQVHFLFGDIEETDQPKKRQFFSPEIPVSSSKPKGLHRSTYEMLVAKIVILYELKNSAIRRQVGYTGREIREATSRAKILLRIGK